MVQKSYYMDNQTDAQVRTSTTTNVGTIFIVPYATVTGNVTWANSTSPVVGALLTSNSRDLYVFGNVQATTNGYGHFSLGVPPLPVKINVNPPGNAQPNWTWVNLTPKQTVDIGTIYIVRMTFVTATLVDAITGSTISTSSYYEALTACNRLTGKCLNQGATAGPYPAQTTTLGTPAIPGPTWIQAYAFCPTCALTGYVTNATFVTDVPVEPPGKSFNLGKIYMTPDGFFSVTSKLSWGADKSVWPQGTFLEVNGCSLDSVSVSIAIINFNVYPATVNMSSTPCLGTCFFPGTSSGAVAAPPLRVYIRIQPDLNNVCGNFAPTWPNPGDFPVPLVQNTFANETFANLTPGQVTKLGALDITPGAYIDGHVYLQGSTAAPPQGFSVQVCSTDVPSWCGVGTTSISNLPWWASANGCSGNPYTTFCAPAPPGPDKITVTGPGYSTNYTWAYVKPGCCNAASSALTLYQVTNPHITSINLSNGWLLPNQTGVPAANGSVSGIVYALQTSLPPGGLASVTACSALAAQQVLTCSQGVEDPATGKFLISDAPVGWDVIQVTAPLYQSNSTWVFVNQSANEPIGTIYITPESTLSGQVVTPTGQGILFAHVVACPVADPNNCIPIGYLGQTGTSGQYFGFLQAGQIPEGIYRINASAAGYLSNWVWVNITVGNASVAPTIVLFPVGNGAASARAASAVHPLTTSLLSGGIWVDGRTTNNLTGAPVVGAQVVACPVGSTLCLSFTDATSTGGEFNDSLPHGEYYINASSPNFYPGSAFINVTAGFAYHVGDITLVPYPWVTGRALIDPWNSLGTTHKGGLLGPSDLPVSICKLGACSVQTFASTNTGGFYNVSAPFGRGWGVHVIPNSQGPGSALGGYVGNSTYVNVTDAYAAVPVVINMTIFGTMKGRVLDRTTNDSIPVRFTTVATATIRGPNPGTATELSNGAGNYTFFVPPFNKNSSVSAGDSGTAWVLAINRSVGLTPEGNGTIYIDPLSLVHFGWVQALIVSYNHTLVPFATLSGMIADPINHTTISVGGPANGGGFINLSSPPTYPPGFNATFVASGWDFNSSGPIYAPVYSSETTYLRGSQLGKGGGGPNGTLGNITVQEYGFVRTAEVNTIGGAPVIFGAIDFARGNPIYNANVNVVNPEGNGSQAMQVQTNELGQFLIDAPPSKRDNLTLVLPGYVTNLTSLNVPAGRTVVVNPINMTGDGILAGRVVSYPGRTPIVDAQVTVSCAKIGLGCQVYSAVTNATGIFWVLANPGYNALNISAGGFVPNTNTVIRVCSDCWVWAGVLNLSQYAYVEGQVVALPSGLPVSGANVSVCSPIGLGCGNTVVSNTTGIFLLPTPAGKYILQVNATGYNTTDIPISLVPGEILPFYPIFIQQYGYVTGTVLSSTTFAPVANASLVACPKWSGIGSTCTPFFSSNGRGQYTFGGPPGPYQVEVSASGFRNGFATVTVVSGISRAVPPILLVAFGSNTPYPVTGHVLSGSLTGPGVPGATVSAQVNGTTASSTSTDANGLFSLSLLYGTYTLIALANGERPALAVISVTGPTSGIALVLVPMTFFLSGNVTDGATLQPVAGVDLVSSGLILGTTDLSGRYNIALTNGTYVIVVTASSGRGVAYAPVQFTVTINGAPIVRDVSLFAPTATIYGLVRDTTTGLPIGSAQVDFAGQTVNGIPFATHLVSTAAGGFQTTIPQGNYTVTVRANGYSTTRGTLLANAATVPLIAYLLPTPISSSGGMAMLNSWLPALVVAAFLAGIVATLLLVRRPQRPKVGVPPKRVP